MLLSLSSLVVIALLEVEVVVVWLPLGVDDTSKTPIRYSHQPGGWGEGCQIWDRPREACPIFGSIKTSVCFNKKKQSRFAQWPGTSAPGAAHPTG